MEIHINKKKTKMLGVRISTEAHERITKMATKEGVPQTEVARALIEGALKELPETLG